MAESSGCTSWLPLSYKSVRFVQVENRTLAIIHYFIQIIILLYVVVYTIALQKSYQLYDPLTGTTMLKVKGAAAGNNGLGYDSYDLIVPPSERDALFVTTSFVHTSNQTRGVCEGNDDKVELCSDGCGKGNFTYNGRKTGECAPDGKFCMMDTWCPLEDDDSSHAIVLENVNTWTTFVKTNIIFTMYNERLTNTKDKLILGQNLFSFDMFCEKAGITYDDVKHKGAIILVTMKYNCDLNHDVENCKPDMSFDRIDSDSPLSKGYNYRYTVKALNTNGEEVRSLYKVYGIRILFQLTGQGGKFSIVPLMVSLGSGLALFSVATVICDFLLQNVVSGRELYTRRKIETLEADETINAGNLEYVGGYASLGGDGTPHQVDFNDDTI